MKINYFFSIVITTFNRSFLLRNAIKSIQNQTYENYEVLVIDDASTDDTQEIALNLDKIKYVKHSTNQGVSSSRNTGIKHSKFDNIVFLDDDDTFHKNYLEKLNEHLNQYPNIGFTWCGKNNKIYQDRKLIKIESFQYIANSYTDNIPCPMLNYWANSLGVMIKREVFDNVGLFDTNMSIAEDIDLLLRILSKNIDFVSIPTILIDINIDQSIPSLSRQSSSKQEAKNLAILLNKNKIFLLKHTKIWSHYMKSFIIALYRSNNKSVARKEFLKLIKRNPMEIGIIIRVIKYEMRRIV